VTDAIEAVGATAFYLPPYSPDLTQIEQVLSANSKRSYERPPSAPFRKLWRRIRALPENHKRRRMLNFFRLQATLNLSGIRSNDFVVISFYGPAPPADSVGFFCF